MKQGTNLVAFGAVGLISLMRAAPASAHIVMVGDILSRDSDAYGNAQKMSPCDGPRGQGTTYTFQPGATITLSVSEAVPHPSYFRIAFDNDGEDNFVEPKSIDPSEVDPGRPCPYNDDDQCGVGKGDYCNVTSSSGGPTVLWDDLNPHNPSLIDIGTTWTWTVTLPNVECENCTLQVLQIMEDTIHGAYCPQGSCTDHVEAYVEDIYHRCINIKLKRGATNSPGTTNATPQNKGIDCVKMQSSDAGVASPDASVANDAGTGTHDGGSTGGTAGGTGSATDGGAPPVVTAGGPGGTTGSVGGTAAGVGGGTGGIGGVSGTTGGAGTAGGPGGGTDAGIVSPTDDEPTDDGCNCSVSDTSPRWGNLVSMGLLGVALLLRRRRI